MISQVLMRYKVTILNYWSFNIKVIFILCKFNNQIFKKINIDVSSKY